MSDARVAVCLSTLRYHPVYAGPAIRFRRYAPGLAKRGIELDVVTIGESDGNGSSPNGRDWTAHPADVDGVPVYRVPAEASMGLRAEVALSRGMVRYSQSVRRPGVIQLLSLSQWFVPWLYRLRRERIPMVFTRTMVRDPSVATYKLLPMVPAYRLLDCVVVSSGIMRDSLRREGITGRVEVIPNGVDVQRFRPVESEEEKRWIRGKLGLPVDSELIVFIGGFLSERKGVDILAEAWRILGPKRPQATLVLVGPQPDASRKPGQEAFIARVESSLEASGARDRVVFTGAVDNVADYLRAADVFVFPSRREGMPNVVPEAYACGAAAVLTPFIGLPAEFGRAGEQYLLAEHQPESLAAAVEEVLDNPERRRQLSQSARDWVVRELDLELSLDKYAALYRDLAGTSGR